MEEMYDVFTKEGEYLGTRPASICESENPGFYYKIVWTILLNENNEILYASYNLPKCYEVLSNISSSLNNKLSLQSFDLKEPLFIGSNYVFFASLGPKVNIKINYIDMSLSNIYTKITDYGMNNALIEMYVTINIKGRIFTPVLEQEETIKYDMLISSMIINGRVPTFYGGMITTSSNYFDIPILM